MSKIINLEIKSCSECPFQMSELIASDVRGVFFATKPICKKNRKIELIQSELIKDKIPIECPLPNKVTPTTNHCSDAIEYFLAHKQIRLNKKLEDKCKKCQSISVERDYALGGFYCHDCQEYTG